MKPPMYIGPEKQLIGMPAPPTETLVNQLIDQCHKDSEEFIRTRHRAPLIRVIQAIINLNRLGYDFIWDRRHHLVGAHRKGAIHATRLADTTTAN